MDERDLLTALAAFDRALHIAGSQSALARICGCTPGAIYQPRKQGKPLSARFVLKVEAATGVSRHDLRPDFYPMPGEAALHDASVSEKTISVACNPAPVLPKAPAND
ncbi:transcriptional regulator [Sphingomonas elodea]|uniref:transcriptional regulator n=1 Tax=Sphingomonas elodea TaxID=179878 RepID=UPI0009FFA303|nr:YdaS family helix-turn-helix protein [Sphingomonas elodea]